MSLTLQERATAAGIGTLFPDSMFSEKELAFLHGLVDDYAFQRAVRDGEPALLVHGRVSQNQTSKLLGVSRLTIDRWLRSGQLRRREWLFPSDRCVDAEHIREIVLTQVSNADLLPPVLAYSWSVFVESGTYRSALEWQRLRLAEPMAKGLRKDWMMRLAREFAAAKEKN